MNSMTSSGAKIFSHIYIERAILDHPVTKRILKHFKTNQYIIIEDYAHLFNRHNQDFKAQKKAQNLILAKKQYGFYYEGSPYCESFGIRRFYYTGMIMNCLYDCSYCYLKSIYPSGHMVIFVNNDDFITAVERNLLKENDPVYLAISYDSDLLAMDKITGFLDSWLSLAQKYPLLTIEVKTKIGSFPLIQKTPSNVIFAWSLLPDAVIKRYETHTPSLKSRLCAIKSALDAGARVRLSIEPLMPILNAEAVYTHFTQYLAETIDLKQIHDINIGGFRISGKQFKTFYKRDPTSPVFAYPLTEISGEAFYAGEETLIECVVSTLKNFANAEKIIVYHKDS